MRRFCGWLVLLCASGAVGCSGATAGSGSVGQTATNAGPASISASAARSSLTAAGPGTSGSSAAAGAGTSGSTGTASAAVAGSSGNANSSGTGIAATAASGGATGSTGTASTGSSDGGLPPPGNPDGSCTTLSLPPEAQPADSSHPTSVVGTGDPASCSFAMLAAAVSEGGVVTFNCGPAPITIPISSSLTPPTSNAYAKDPAIDTVIDGAGLVTLDGQSSVQIINWNHAGSWRLNTDTLTLQNLALINGKSTPTMAIPACPPSGGISNSACSTGWDDGEGGALYVRDGNVRIINCVFANNQAALLGPDTGGGAIYLLGTANPAYIAHSTFQSNTASNAGAVGMLWAGAFIFNSLFESNSGVGTGANNNDPTMCTCMNNGQNQTGSGGNGGAIYKDGADGVALTICGTEIRDNSCNEFGPAVFLTADGSNAQLILDDDLLESNTTPTPTGTGAPASPPTTRT